MSDKSIERKLVSINEKKKINFFIPLNVVIIDADKIGSSILKTVFERIEDINNVSIFEDPVEALKTFEKDESNALLIDIFSLGIEKGIEIIKTVRNKYPNAPVCLLGSRDSLMNLPGVPKEWSLRFSHYYKLAKDQIPNNLRTDSERMVYKLFTYLLARTARVRLGNLRNLIAHDKLPSEITTKIEDTVKFAEQALSIKEKSSTNIVPGFDQEDVQSLIKDTLEKASKALDRTSFVNRIVLFFGIFLVFISFICLKSN